MTLSPDRRALQSLRYGPHQKGEETATEAARSTGVIYINPQSRAP